MLIETRLSAQVRPSPYFFNRTLDVILIIGAPLFALLLGMIIAYSPWAIQELELNHNRESFASIGIGIFTMAHLVIVVVRSYLNPVVFNRFKKRLILGPFILFVGMMLSSWILIFVFVVAVWWDVYHSSLQTFGIGRIYDSRAGNDSDQGRRLDWGINLLFYVGPVVSGLSFLEHLVHFQKFDQVGTPLFAKIPAFAMTYQKYVTWGMILFGSIFVLYYLWQYRKLQKNGYQISSQKIQLFAATGVCSIYTWGFNPFGQAFFIMNFFHALQYFALIWWSEGKNMTALCRLNHVKWGGYATWMIFGVVAITYGVWAKLWGESNHMAFSILLTVSIMHFWFDGFIWSVRKAHVK